MITTPMAGITVMGVSASAAARADSIQLSLRVTTRSSTMPISDADLKALSDGLVQAGATRRSITSLTLPGGGLLTAGEAATLMHPTDAQLRHAFDTLDATMKALPNLSLQQLSMTFIANDCSAITEQARRLALARAHSQALQVAAQEHVRLGRLESVIVSPAVGALSVDATPNGCQATYYLGAGYPPYLQTASMFNLRISATVTVTYAILR
jgi:hypothetical protein